MDEKHNFYLYDAAAKIAQLVKHPELRFLKEVQHIETCSNQSRHQWESGAKKLECRIKYADWASRKTTTYMLRHCILKAYVYLLSKGADTLLVRTK